MKLREALLGKLSEKEMAGLKTAFDVVGDIAILEIDRELRKKEKIIAKILLQLHPQIKTVLRKAGSHTGKLRLQKMKHLAGRKTMETVHKESGVELRLDVEKVYFSVRLGTERLRIAKQVQPGEEVLVMFSGCAPYPCVIAKNSPARKVYGIELNKLGHAYGVENVFRNRLLPVRPIQGDVRQILSNFYKHIIALKTKMQDREIKKLLTKKPKAIELFLVGEDLFEKEQRTRAWIKKLQKMGIAVILYVARNRDNKHLSLCRQDVRADLEALEKAGQFCKELRVRAITHYTDATESHEGFLYQNLERIKRYLPYFYFETPNRGIFADYHKFLEVGQKARMKNVCIDTCHLYEYYRDNGKVLDAVKALSKAFNPYFHLVDADGITHGLEIGKGRVNFDAIMPYVGEGTVEIICKDYNNPVEMFRSYDRILEYRKTFDRVVMPLPHGAENFLDLALAAIKPGGIIHFYDVLHEKEMPKKAVAKIEKACKKAKRK
ncbi:hypothetical protein HY488_03175, partial [Candidatus Woesearchaeota archaeon]|nr:hypothetical protein [Candidatus Woesearchaeota archaeon]